MTHEESVMEFLGKPLYAKYKEPTLNSTWLPEGVDEEMTDEETEASWTMYVETVWGK